MLAAIAPQSPVSFMPSVAKMPSILLTIERPHRIFTEAEGRRNRFNVANRR
jgi:hypothetical protein